MFEGLLFSIDLIGIPVALNMFGREKSKTIFGGVCSILFFGFVLWSVYNVGYEIISALNPKIVTFEYYQDDPRPITLSRENFPVSFVLQMPTVLGSQPFKDESIFKMDITHLMVRRKNDEEGHSSEEWFVSKVYTEDCPRDYYSALESGLNDIDFDTSYCIAKEQPELERLEVQGLFSSKNYQALEVQVSMCNNDTSPIPCAPKETIKEYLAGSWFNAFYVNMVVNPQNYTNPNNTFKDLYYTMMNPNSYRETELSLGYVQIDTDSGWLTENFNTKSYTKVNSIREFIDTSPRSDGVMMKCIIMSSQLETYYTRSYKKIQGVLAEAGGMANAVLVIMIFAVNPFMKLKFRESIMNEVFDIRMPQKRRGSKGNKKSKTCSIELSPDASPDNRSKVQERGKTTLNLLKSEMFTNLNSTEEIKGHESGFLKSPLSPERQRLNERDPEKKKSLFASSPRQSFTSVLQLPKEPEKKHSIDLVLPINPINTKPPSHLEKPQETGEDKLENRRDEITRKESGNYEDQFARLKSLKSDLKKKNRKLKLIDKNDSFKVKEKSLHDENSLHLSFPSNSDVSDIEAEEKKVDVSPYEIVKSEQHKEIEIENYQSGQEEEVIPKQSQKKVLGETKESIDKEKEKAAAKNKIQLDTSIWEYVTEFMWKSGSRKKQKEAFKEGLKRIDERLDIINVMKKLREIDKLRALLLDPDQLVLFNNLPKPVIQLVDGSTLRRSSASVVQLENLQFVHEETPEEQIVDSINNLKNRAEKSEIDRKLIEMFENESYS